MDSPGSGCLGNTLISLLGHMSISDTLRSHEYLLQSLALKFEKSLFQDPTTSDQFFFLFFSKFCSPIRNHLKLPNAADFLWSLLATSQWITSCVET